MSIPRGVTGVVQLPNSDVVRQLSCAVNHGEDLDVGLTELFNEAIAEDDSLSDVLVVPFRDAAADATELGEVSGF